MGTKIMADKIGRGTSDTLTTDGNFVVGDNNTDTMTVNARVSSNLTPSDNNLYSLGIDTHQWNTAYINNLHLADSAGSNGQLLYNAVSGQIGATSNIYSDGQNLGIGEPSPTHSLDIVSQTANGSRIRIQQNQGANADGPDIKFQRGRGTTETPANLSSNDSIGRFEVFSYSSGSAGYISSGNFGWTCPDDFGEGNSKFTLQVRVRNDLGNSVLRTIMQSDPAGPILFTGSLQPNTDEGFDLGSEAGPKRWDNVYAANIKPSTITAVAAGTTLSGVFDFSSATISSLEVSDLTVMDGVIEISYGIQVPFTSVLVKNFKNLLIIDSY